LTEEVLKKFAIPLLASLAFAGLVPTIAGAQTVRTETMEHPRIATAIREMESAIRYMEAAPHDFGGHKEAAIGATRAALVELRAAMAFRARIDRR
jgi:hypothetical protein